jgi:Na+-translocating ferredoxin:NAD+ oxidoreductase RNF subunit RnfB
MKTVENYHAIKVNNDKCIGCTHCMKACPTEAIRVIKGKAHINDDRCVDCGNCLRACPVKAFYVEHDELDQLRTFPHRVLLFPAVMIGQFPVKYTEDQIYQACLNLGFNHVLEVEQPIGWLIEMMRGEVHKKNDMPKISSFCPAIVRLIQIKYPSLAEHIVPFHAPHDLAANYIVAQLAKQGIDRNQIGIFYVSPCSAKLAAVKRPFGNKSTMVDGLINMNDLYNRIMKQMQNLQVAETTHLRKNITIDGTLWSLPRGEAREFKNRSMAIDGIHNVVKFLERLEKDDVPELDFLELKSCSQGCAGGILLTGNRFLTVERLKKRAANYPTAAKLNYTDDCKESVQQKMISGPFIPKPAFRLDTDRQKALMKIQKIDKILCQLPGIDCGGCGAPNCHALAEDMVQGKAKMTSCIFLQKRYLRDNKMDIGRVFKNLDKIWGPNRIEADCSKKGGRNEGY